MISETGKFITLEGGEGSGKSTQIKILSDFLKAKNVDHIITREPGGSEGAEAIRRLVLTGEPGRWSTMSEALLVTAGRADHVERVIRPALEAGTWVISDRFFDSTKVYQGAAGGLGIDRVTELQTFALGDFKPDLTLILDIDVETGLGRATDREAQNEHAEDRFEKMGTAFHKTLRQAYLDIAMAEPERCRVIDANRSFEAISESINLEITRLLEHT